MGKLRWWDDPTTLMSFADWSEEEGVYELNREAVKRILQCV